MALKDFFTLFPRYLKVAGDRPLVDSLVVPSEIRYTMKLYVGMPSSHLQGVAGYVNEVLAKGKSYLGVEILPLSNRLSQELMTRATKGTRAFIIAFVYREKLKHPLTVTGHLQVYIAEADTLEKLVELINQFADSNAVTDISLNALENLEHGKPPTYWAKVMYYI